MTALFNALVGAVSTSFTADTQIGQQTLSNPSTSAGFFLGLPVFGPGIPRGAIITNLSPLTISLAATETATGAALKTGFLTTLRRANFTKNVPCPALYLRSLEEENVYDGPFQELTMKAEAIIVSNAGENPDVIPETALNNFLDALQSAMEPDEPSRTRFTLGGLVYWCRMKGKVDKSPGDIGPQALAYADIEIIVP